MRSAFEISRNTRLVYVALDYQKNSGNMQHTQQSVAVSFTFFISLLRSVYVSVAFIRLCSVEMNSRFANWAVSLSALSCLCWMTVGVFVCVYVCAKDLLTYPHEPLEFAHTLAFFNIKNVGWALHLSVCVCHEPHSSIQQSLMRMWRALVPNEHGTLSPKKEELRAKESGKRATLSYLRVDKRHWSKLQVLWMKTTAPLWNALFQKLHADNPSTCFNRL